MRFDCVFFDSGGTLFGAGGSEPTPEEVWQGRIGRVAALLDGLGISTDPEALRASVLKSEQQCPRQFGTAYNFLRLMMAMLDELGLPAGAEVAACLADAYAGPRYESWVFAGTKEALARLRSAGVHLGLIANTAWPGFCLDRALAGVGLLEFLSTRLYSGDIGIAKPDERIFRLAEERSSMAGKRLLYVGNDLEADIKGARAAGWATAMRKSTHLTSGGLADFEFDETAELLRFVL